MKIQFIKHALKFGIPFALASIYMSIFYLFRYSGRNRKKYPIEKRFKKTYQLMKVAEKYCGIVPHLEGVENIPNEVCYFVSNHQSSTDPIIFFLASKKPVSFIAKKEVKKIPIIGRCIRANDGVFLPREDLKESFKTMLKVQQSLENKENSWVIFAEGTRNRDSLKNLLPFHHGSFRPVIKAKVPIVPCVIYGTFRIADKNCALKKFPVQVHFLKPIMPFEYENKSTHEVATMVRDLINEEIAYRMIPKDVTYIKELDPHYDLLKLGKTF